MLLYASLDFEQSHLKFIRCQLNYSAKNESLCVLPMRFMANMAGENVTNVVVFKYDKWNETTDQLICTMPLAHVLMEPTVVCQYRAKMINVIHLYVRVFCWATFTAGTLASIDIIKLDVWQWVIMTGILVRPCPLSLRSGCVDEGAQSLVFNSVQHQMPAELGAFQHQIDTSWYNGNTF